MSLARTVALVALLRLIHTAINCLIRTFLQIDLQKLLDKAAGAKQANMFEGKGDVVRVLIRVVSDAIMHDFGVQLHHEYPHLMNFVET